MIQFATFQYVAGWLGLYLFDEGRPILNTTVKSLHDLSPLCLFSFSVSVSASNILERNSWGGMNKKKKQPLDSRTAAKCSSS